MTVNVVYNLTAEVIPESDPHGLSPAEPGAKLDLGKLDLLRAVQEFPHALHQVGLVGDHGAAKYSEGGWRHVPDGIRRYTAALLRHVATRELVDPSSELAHASHAAWNALARLELLLEGGTDADRYRPGPGPCSVHGTRDFDRSVLRADVEGLPGAAR